MVEATVMLYRKSRWEGWLFVSCWWFGQCCGFSWKQNLPCVTV